MNITPDYSTYDVIKSETKTLTDSLEKIHNTIDQSQNKSKSTLSEAHAHINTELSAATESLSRTIKLIKRDAKSENSAHNLNKLNAIINECSNKYKEVIEKLQDFNDQAEKEVKISKKKKKEISQILHQSSETLRELEKTSKLISKKVTIIVQKQNINPPLRDEKELDSTAILPRFDIFIDQMKELTANEMEYEWLRDLVTKVKLKNDEIDENLVSELLDIFEKEETDNQILENINEIIRHYLSVLQNEVAKTKNRKMDLLKELNEELKKVVKQDPDSEERLNAELKCFIIYQQIQNNPFDLPIKIELKKDDSSVSLLKDLINRRSSEPHLKTYPHNENTLSYKNEGLKRIQARYLEDLPNQKNGEILISGAGPTGLLYALTYALQGKEFTLLEARGEDDSKRKNIIVLGKEDLKQKLKMLEAFESVGSYTAADMKLMEFFGITDQLYVNNQTTTFGTENNPVWFQVSIENLQNAMIERLSELVSDELKERGFIRYNTRISEVSLDENLENANVTWNTKDSKDSETIQPKVVHVCEGYRASTRDLLGIHVYKLSTVEPVAISYFSREEITSVNQEFKDSIKLAQHIPKLISQALTYSYKASHNPEEQERNYFQTIGKFELLLTSPAYDYFYTTLNAEQKKEHEKIRNRIEKVENRWANEIIRFLKKTDASEEFIEQFSETNRKKWLTDDTKRLEVFEKLQIISDKFPKEIPSFDLQKTLKTFEKKLTRLNRDLDHLYKQLTNSHVRHRVYNRFLFNQNPLLRDYQESIFTKSQLSNAETSSLRIGKTRFSLEGDAKTTTDPTTGSGLRTGALRTIFSPEIYINPELAENPISQSSADWAVELSARSMREEGFYMRDIYVPGSERVERYLDIAKEARVLTDEDCRNLLQLRSKIKAARTAKIPMKTDLSDFRNKIRAEYLNQKKFLTNISESEIDLRLSKTASDDTFQQIIELFKNTKDPPTREKVNQFLEKQYIRNISNSEMHKIAEIIKETDDSKHLKKVLKKILFPFEFPGNPKLSKKEEIIFIKVWKAALLDQDLNLTQKEMNTFKSACGKIAVAKDIKDTINFNYKPEVWFTYLYIYSKNLEVRAAAM